MTDKHDFKAALDRYPLHIHEDDLEATKAALRLADKLQNGGVSKSMMDISDEYGAVDAYGFIKAMSAQMIKETK